MNKFLRYLENINDLIVFKHSIFALPFIFVAMITASSELNGTMFFGFKLLFLALLSAVSARNYAMAFNRYLDMDIDAGNPRCENRPSVDGRMSQKSIVFFIIANGFLFVLSAYFINNLAFYLAFPILVALAAYSTFKRFTTGSHLMLGFCDGLAPIAGSVAVGAYIPLWSLMLCLSVTFWVAGFDILYSLQDVAFDRKKKLFSIPSIYGHEASMYISKLFHGLAVLFWFLYALSANLGFIAYLGIFISAAILYQEHIIVNRDFRKIDKAFFTLNGYLGIAFFFFIFFDLLWR